MFSKQKTSNDPVCSGKSSRNSRSFRRALLGSRGNRRTAKVAPLSVDNSEQNGTLVSLKQTIIDWEISCVIGLELEL